MELAKTNNGRWLPGQSGNINGRPVPTGHYSLTNRTVRRMATFRVISAPTAPACRETPDNRRVRMGCIMVLSSGGVPMPLTDAIPEARA